MSLLGKLADRSILLALRLFTREARALRHAIEAQTDSYREVHHLPLLYQPAEPLLTAIRDAPEATPGRFLRAGDFQSVYLIQELAAEFRIPLTDETDLEALAIDRGWVTPEGVFLQYPESARGLSVGVL